MPGLHLIVDVRGSLAPEKFVRVDDVASLFNSIIAATEMIAIGEAQYFTFDADIARGFEDGLTAMQCLSTSHLSFHSVIENGGFFFDMFSCKEFDAEAVLDLITCWVGNDAAKVNSVAILR